MDRTLRFINCNEEIKKIIPMYIEPFVKFYGEECRQEIEEKFNSLLCLGYRNPKLMENSIARYENNKTEELLKSIYEKTNIPIEKITGKSVISFKNKDIMPINYFYKFMDLYNLKEEGRRQKAYEEGFDFVNRYMKISKEEYNEIYKTKQLPEKLKNLDEWGKNRILHFIDDNFAKEKYDRAYKNTENLLKQIIPEITKDNCNELLNNEKIQELLSLRNEFEIASQKFKEIEKELTPYYEKIEEIKKSSEEINEKLYKAFLKENFDLFPKHLKGQIEDYLNGKKEYLNYDLKNLLGGKSSINSYIDSFFEEAENILNDSNTREWRKNSIKENRIKFFKTMGLDLGNDYKNYENSLEATKIIPSKERIEKLVESRNNYENKYNNLFYASQKNHQQLLKEIESRNYVEKETPINASLYTKNCNFSAFISPNYIKTENGYKESLILAVNFDNFDNVFLDHIIVHELNHVMETSLILANDKEYEFYSGWDIVSGEVNSDQSEEVDTINERDKRKYELFNEIINELIAQEISKIMHEENMHILDEKDNSKYIGGTGYEKSAFLVMKFFNEFRDAILKSRRNGNIQVILDEVGKENFEALNDLLVIFNKKFPGLKSYNLYSDLKKGEDTPETRIYYNLCDKRDNILENMRKYRDNQKVEIKGETK